MEINYDFSPEAFKKYMTIGLGRTHLILERANNISIYKDIVLYGCINNLSYDVQSEGTRANYVYDLMKYFKDDQFFENQVISKYITEVDYSTFCHLCDMLSLFYKENKSELAKNAIETKYLEFINKQVFDYDDKLKLDYLLVYLKYSHGIKMVRKICVDIDILIGNNVIHVNDLGWFFSTILQSYKSISAFINRNCSHYHTNDIKNISETENRDKERELLLNADILINMINEGNWKVQNSFWFARKASDEEKLKLVNYLKQESDDEVKRQILQIISKGNFPITFDYLIDLYNSNYLKNTILKVIININDSRIRKFGYSLIEDENLRHFGLEMICKFYENEDRDLLLKYVPKVKVNDDEIYWHSLFGAVLKLIDQNKNSSLVELLIYMYENSLCSFCRENYLLRMNQFKLLTNDIIEEAIYDSNSDIRKFANKIIRKWNKETRER